MTLILLTALVFISGLALAHALRVTGFAARVLFAGTFAMVLIVAIETALGATGFLTQPLIIIASVAMSVPVLVISAWVIGPPRWGEVIASDLRGLRGTVSLLRHPEIAILSVLAGIVCLWTALVIMYLPPRSVDDLCYHLSTIFETILRGHFFLFPLDFRPHFAYPLNADLLFLWPTLLLGNIHWVEAGQAVAALLAAVGIAALARELGASPRFSMIGALLFLLLPITPKQATSCYTDLILAAFYAAALMGAVRYARDGSTSALLLSGMGAGLLAGTKYNYMIPILAIVPLLFLGMRKAPTLWQGWKRLMFLFLLPSVALCAYWFIRNLILLGNPVYPHQLGLGPLTLFYSALPSNHMLVQSKSYIESLFKEPLSLFEVFFGDASLGGPDGGFGPLFWGAVIPIGLGYLVIAARKFYRNGKTLPLLISLQFPAALLPYLICQWIVSPVTIRFLLAAAVPGIALLVYALDHLQKSRPVLAAAALISLVLAVTLPLTSIAGSSDQIERKQIMSLGDVTQAMREEWSGSPWRFARKSSIGITYFAELWEMLDLISKPPGQQACPLWVFTTGDYPAGFYGTYLQNRLWNLDSPDCPESPDILCFLMGPKDDKFNILYYGDHIIRIEEVAGQPNDYDLVNVIGPILIYARREVIAPEGKLRERFAAFYETAKAREVAAARSFSYRSDEGVILSADLVGYGLKALELRGEIRARVVLTWPEDIDRLASFFAEQGRVLALVPKELAHEPTLGKLKSDGKDLVLVDITSRYSPSSTLETAAENTKGVRQ